jgi:predicted hydrocarbon binding protein
MTTTTGRTEGVLIGKRALHQMRAVLDRETGVKAALLLREIGFATGEAVHEAFEQWSRTHYQVDAARELDTTFLGEALGGFFADAGWGTVSLTELTPSVLALDSPAWAEAQSDGAEYPSCHFSCGLLADFFTRLGGSRAAVMEVECGSRGEARCRFLVGSPDMLTYLYERMTSGMSYTQALAEP